MYQDSAHRTRSLALLLSAGALLAASGTVLGKGGKECWLEVYDQANYQGRHVRIEGPAELASLSNLNGQDWSNRIESLKVGADAQVVAFRKPNFENEPEGPVNHPHAFKQWGEQEIPAYQEQEISFGPGKREHHLGDLKFHRNINSLKIQCRK